MEKFGSMSFCNGQFWLTVTEAGCYNMSLSLNYER